MRLAAYVGLALIFAPTIGDDLVAQAPSPTSPAISPARIAEIMEHARRYGWCTSVGSVTTAPLGLTEPGVRYMALQIGLRAGSRRHFWSIHEQPRPVVYLFVIEGRSADQWTFDLNGNLLRAGLVRDGRFQLISPEQARAAFDAELRLWSEADLTPPPQSPPRPCPQ